ncbi:MAG: hypothetical protein KatS3mg097_325 [Candidatus Parcubacteria bacterium]|nr:MAG: hypothetical protein KatS3mg097_325 [Candidatus Parcubacteria bacterium]
MSEVYFANLFALLALAFIIGVHSVYLSNFFIIYNFILALFIYYFFRLKISLLFFCFTLLGSLYVFLWHSLDFNFFDYVTIFLDLTQKYRNFITEKIYFYLPYDYADIFLSILFGAPFKDYDLKKAFINSGLIHITAVSGQNLTLMFSVVYEALKALRVLSLGFLFYISILIIIFFVLIMGFAGNVLRAALMGLLIIIVKNRFGRLPLKRNIIIAAALLLILFKPNSFLVDIGTQFSFLAIIGIFYISPILYQRLDFLTKDFIKKIVSETIGAQLAVLPLLIYYFANFNLLSSIANILVMPFMSSFLTLATVFLFIPLPPIALLTLPLIFYIKTIAIFFSQFVVYFYLPLLVVIAYYAFLLIKIIKWHKNATIDFRFNFD